VLNIVPYAKSMMGHTNCTSLVTVVSIILMVLLSKGMGVQEVHKRTDTRKTVQIRESAKGKFFLR
jgi:hypothetical protein